MHNGGDHTDLVVAVNEQVLLGRVRAKELKPGCRILLESMWRHHADTGVAAAYARTCERLIDAGYQLHDIPMEQECRAIVADGRRGKRSSVGAGF